MSRTQSRFARLAIVASVLCAPRAWADDRGTLGYLLSRPSSASGTGGAHSFALRWDRLWLPYLEAGAGVELGFSSGNEPLQRYALLPGVAFVHPVGDLVLRVEEQAGWQVVHGRLTLGGIPLSGTETRSFHNAFAFAVDAPITDAIDIRARLGIEIDGIYPVGHASTFVGPFVGIAIVAHRARCGATSRSRPCPGT